MIVSFPWDPPQWSPNHPYSRPLPERPEGWAKPEIIWSDSGQVEVWSTHTASEFSLGVWNVREEWESSATDVRDIERAGLTEDEVVDVEIYLNRVYERCAPAAYFVAEKALAVIAATLIDSQLEES